MPQYLSPGVYVEEVDSGSRPIEGVGTAVAAFVGIAASGPLHEPTLVSNWTQFTNIFGEFVEGSYLAHSVYGYFMNGGGNAYIVRIGSEGRKGASPGTMAQAALGPGQPDREPPYTVSALEAGPAGNDITVEITHPEQQEGQEEPPADQFNIIVRRGGNLEETFEGVTTRRGKANAATVVREQSKLIRLEATSGSIERPAAGSISLSGGNVPALPDRISPDEYVGDVADRTGIGALETIDEVTMVSVPDLSAAYDRGAIDAEQFKAVQLAMITHCELMGDRVAILDPPPDLTAQQIKEWRVEKAGYDSKFATLYWPWIKVLDPQSGQAIFMPPSGHMAGIWARNDDERGVHKAPANEVVRGAISLECSDHPQRARPAQPRGHQLPCGPSRAVASGCGAPARCRATRRGATSTCGGCSTTSRSRSSTTPTGSSSSPTTATCGPRSGARSPRSWSWSGARARCSARRRPRPSSSSATTRPTRPRPSTSGRSPARSAWRR